MIRPERKGNAVPLTKLLLYCGDALLVEGVVSVNVKLGNARKLGVAPEIYIFGRPAVLGIERKRPVPRLAVVVGIRSLALYRNALVNGTVAEPVQCSIARKLAARKVNRLRIGLLSLADVKALAHL